MRVRRDIEVWQSGSVIIWRLDEVINEAAIYICAFLIVERFVFLKQLYTPRINV